MRSMDANDPIKERALKAAKEAIKKSILENKELLKGATTGDKLEIRTSGEIAEELSSDELQKVFDKVMEETLFSKK